MKTKIINMFGGPGCGKTTMSAKIFGYLKEARRNVEYVPEFAKELVWQESSCIKDQLYLLGVQHHRLFSLQGKVEYIITDSPLMLSAYYIDLAENIFGSDRTFQCYKRTFKNLVFDTVDLYDNLNFFCERGNRKFIQAGRLQNETQAKDIDASLRFMLKENGYAFTTVSKINDVLSILNRSENEQFDFV